MPPHTLVPSTPWMTEEEISCFAKWLPHACICLEFGMGGSTRFLFEQGAREVISVESDPSWVTNVCDDPMIKHFLSKKKFNPYHADIGPVTICGTPFGAPSITWLAYHTHIWNDIVAESLDFVLVDGRFRVACALQAFLRCRQETIYLVHDFSERPCYWAILDFANVLDRQGTSIVLQRKKNPAWRKLALTFLEYQFDSQ